MGPERQKRSERNTSAPYPSGAPTTTPKTVSTVASSLYFEDHSGRHKIRTSTPSSTPTPSQLPKPSLQFPFEFRQIPRYYKSFSKYLEKKINTYKCLQTVEQLLAEKGCTIPDSNLIIVEEDLKVVSADNKPLLFFFKHGLQRPFNMDPSPKGYEALKDFVQAYPPPKPTNSDARHYGDIENAENGVYHICVWQATGHENEKKALETITKGAVLSAEARNAGYKANAVAMVMNGLTPVIQACGILFEVVDEANYHRYKSLYDTVAKNSALCWLQTTGRNCFLGMAILVGLCCKPHRDVRDTMDGWVADTVFGDFDGGFLKVPQVGRQFRLQQGDVIFMRSALLQHSVSPTTRGKRFGMVLFTHQMMHSNTR